MSWVLKAVLRTLDFKNNGFKGFKVESDIIMFY